MRLFQALLSASLGFSNCSSCCSPSAKVPKVENTCLEAVPNHNNTSEERINLIFVRLNLGTTEFEQYVEKSLEKFSATEPFASNKDNFNFWKAETMGMVDDYKAGSDERAPEAKAMAEELAKACPFSNSATIAFINWEFRANADNPNFAGLKLYQMNLENIAKYRKQFSQLPLENCLSAAKACSSDNENEFCSTLQSMRGKLEPSLDAKSCYLLKPKFGIVKLSTHSQSPENTGKVFLHELGHIFDLEDEYFKDEDSQKEKREINCYLAKTELECREQAPWKKFIGQGPMGCYQGCDKVKTVRSIPIWRSIDNGIMNDGSDTYGTWNELHICNVFKAVLGKSEGSCKKYSE